MCGSSPPKVDPPPPAPEPLKYADEGQAEARRQNAQQYSASVGPQSTVLTGQAGDTSTALTGKTKLGT